MLWRSTPEAAQAMRKKINKAYDNMRTNLYDKVQYMQQKIVY